MNVSFRPCYTLDFAAILTDEQLEKVVSLINNNTRDDETLITELKLYLSGIADQLEQKGVGSDYLAYWLFAKARGII